MPGNANRDVVYECHAFLLHLSRIQRRVAFAADKHRNQRRKDHESSPYINRPIALVNVLANEAGVEDEPILMAAVLHGTIEDTETTEQGLARLFGKGVADSHYSLAR